MKTAYRTHSCGALRAADEGHEVTLSGWANSVRDQGGVLFVNLRDRYGVTQVTFRGDKDADLLKAAERVRPEWVLQVRGKVLRRPEDAVNANMDTGDIEVEVRHLEVLSEAEPCGRRSSGGGLTSPEGRVGRGVGKRRTGCRAILDR